MFMGSSSARRSRSLLAASAAVISVLAAGPAAEAAQRPPVMGPTAGVAGGDPLVTAVGLEMLYAGGNAFDAGVAMLLVGGVIEQDLYSLGGEALILVHPQDEDEVTAVVGQGWASKNATIEWYRSRGKTLAGEGLDPSVVPGALHAALVTLERWGTMSFERVSERAIQYARDGFPLRPRTAESIVNNLEFFEAWPDNQAFWLREDGTPHEAGDLIRMPDLADTLTRMVEAERAAGGTREAGIVAARDRFYKGDIAEDMMAFLSQHETPWELSDFSEFHSRVYAAPSTEYRGYEVFKHDFGSQGPVLLQTLNILENFDLQAMGHNSPDYLHTVVEAMKLAYADRDTYYADPEFVEIPGVGLLSDAYAADRAALIDPARASTRLRAGDPLPHDPNVTEWPYWVADEEAGRPDGVPPPSAEPIRGTETAPMDSGSLEPAAPDALLQPVGYAAPRLADDPQGFRKDTTHMAVIDAEGNVFDSTPSGGWIGGAVILGDTGVPMSVRGEQFWLNDQVANQLRPRARPRYSLTPSIVLRDGEPFMAIGTPGGDNQDQTILQAFLNIVEFWPAWYPNLHEATEWPRVSSSHFHGSFWPHDTGLNKLTVEEPVGEDVIAELKARGHDVVVDEPFSIGGCATVVLIDPETDVRIAGADPRRYCYAAAY